MQKRRVCARAAHGAGKSSLSAWAVLWFALTRDISEDWKIPCTASAWRQLREYLFPEIRKWAQRLRWQEIGRPPFVEGDELQSLALRLRSGQAVAVASNNPALIEGVHADSLLYVFDEAKAIPAATFDAAEGAFSGEAAASESYALVVSTPGAPEGRFYDIQKRKPGYEDWWVRKISIDEVINAGRISQEWVDQRRRQWGATSPTFINRVLGDFSEKSGQSFIPLSWVEAACDRWDKLDKGSLTGMHYIGIDPARYGDDRTAVAIGRDYCILDIDYYQGTSTMETAGLAAETIRKLGGDIPVGIETNGVGAGVYDRLAELGYLVTPINVSEKTLETDASGELSFFNFRSYLWWMVKDLLDPDNKRGIALPPDSTLITDLTSPRYTYMSDGKLQIESKQRLRERIGRSTDAADAVIFALYIQYGNRVSISVRPRNEW